MRKFSYDLFQEMAEKVGFKFDTSFREAIVTLRLIEELYKIVAYSMGHPDGSSVQCFKEEIDGITKKVVPIEYLFNEEDEQLASELLQNFGLKIQKHNGQCKALYVATR